ncbi:helix-turn-helix transcriptional regulator [Actinopolymorpha sp. B11F2]|uniref:helix-turn-helix domain-containing protein n=1 Tax=Actinopolymorpha sp. B11F2 TaxID=3160862 RepID=UPI0032E3BD74
MHWCITTGGRVVASSAHRQRVGAEVRRIREDLGLSGVQVAEALGWSQSKVSRIETARFAVSVWELAALLDYYAVPEEVRAELLAVTADDSGVDGAWIVRAAGPPRRQREVAAVESRVVRIRQYQAMLIPGQLQTFDYARAIARAGGFANPDEIAVRRRRRQELLEAPDAPSYVAVLDERALTRWPGAQDVLLGQVDHLVQRSKLPAVTLRVLPQGGDAAAMVMAPFTTYEFREGTSPTVVFLETQTADLYLSAAHDVAAYDGLFERLLSESLDPAESVKYLKSLARKTRGKVNRKGKDGNGSGLE